LRFPGITQELLEAVQANYSTSTCLSLGSLAEKMDITNHQLSELINTRFKKSFSQLLREYRIKEAQRMYCRLVYRLGLPRNQISIQLLKKSLEWRRVIFASLT